MPYVTQGTVQVEYKAEGDNAVVISPNPGFRVRHKQRDYIVFRSETSTEPPEIKLLAIIGTTRFTITRGKGKDEMTSALITAATNGTNIELEIEGEEEKERTKIVAVKIPASQKPPEEIRTL